jgi:hypothetical protein
VEELEIKVLPEPRIQLDSHVQIVKNRSYHLISFNFPIGDRPTHHWTSDLPDGLGWDEPSGMQTRSKETRKYWLLREEVPNALQLLLDQHIDEVPKRQGEDVRETKQIVRWFDTSKDVRLVWAVPRLVFREGAGKGLLDKATTRHSSSALCSLPLERDSRRSW